MSFFDEARFKKQEPEATYRKGQKVWADKRGWTVTTETKFRRSFGEVKKTSKFPDCWVTVGIWNKDEFCEWDNWERGVSPKIISLKDIKRLPRPTWKGPKVSGKKRLVERFKSKGRSCNPKSK